MGKVLYRKYRSRGLDEIVGQEHITDTLEQALKRGVISHAYLFTGPRGVGKTSIARILAHRLNDLEYNGEDNHLDIIEIDAASNRGIDEIRDLREKVHLAPSSGKYKVYIIDEVHMLTPQAFNALLKVLEEPPAHVVFILATTESHKVPDTIISRTQRYSFRPIDSDKVVGHLRHIADTEKFKVDDEALSLIARHGEGSFRDSISLLDQAASRGEQITIDSIRTMLGVPPETAITQLLTDLSQSDAKTLIQNLNDLYDHGYQPAAIAKYLAVLARQALLERTAELPDTTLLDLLRQLIDVPASAAPERLLEIVLLGCLQIESRPAKPIEITDVIIETPPEPIQKTPAPLPKAVETAAEEPPAPVVPSKPKKTVAHTGTLDLTVIWPELLQHIKKEHNTLYGILRMAQPTMTAPDQLELAFKYQFHQKRMAESKHRQIVSQTFEDVSGQKVQIEYLYNKELTDIKPIGSLEPAVSEELPPMPESSSLTTVSNIFGGGELLES